MTRILPIILGIVLTVPLFANDTSDMLDAAQMFLKSLNAEQKAKAALPMNSEERMNWHFVPKVRAGLPLKEMEPNQQHLAKALLATGLSNHGLKKSFQIMALEQVLHVMEDNAPHRDPLLYYVAIFGEPGMDTVWGWRVEGHHCSMNFTLQNGKIIASTPLFMGANPHRVMSGIFEGMRVLGDEEDMALKLVKSLNQEQLKVALIAEKAPSDIITSAERKVSPLQPDGLPASAMSPEQAKMLYELVREYVYRVRPVFAERDIKEIEAASPEKITFAWAGDMEIRKGGNYYRVQGPTFLLEYDNTQNQNNHSHTVWRDFNGDFGEDILKQHYEESHQQ